MSSINCNRTIRAMENDSVTLRFEIEIGREMAERAKDIFESYELTRRNLSRGFSAKNIYYATFYK